MLTPEQIERCMQYPPFGDMDNDGARKISDKVVLARKDSTCCICFQVAPAGTHHRVETSVVDGEILSCHCCEICCAAMAVSLDDDTAILARFALANEAEASA